MKKVYSIILLMCSICMAGFASEAKATAGDKGNEVKLGVASAADVVIMSTSLTCGVFTNAKGAVNVSQVSEFYPNLFTGQIGWIAANNLKTITNNNSQVSPGAGFIMHELCDKNSKTKANVVLADGAKRCQIFAFVGDYGTLISDNHLSSSLISSLLKLENYG